MLGVKPGASEEEIKHAYRALAKQWHPDQYANTPQYEVAMEKMKEINAAYDTLTGKTPEGSSASGYYNGAYGSGYSDNYGYDSDDGNEGQARARARMFIQMGDMRSAEQLLLSLSVRNAEWYFLMGAVLASTGRYDSARIHFNQAVEMDPTNTEYRSARDQFEGQSTRFRGRAFGGGSQSDALCCLAQGLMLSSCCFSGRFIPCLFC